MYLNEVNIATVDIFLILKACCTFSYSLDLAFNHMLLSDAFETSWRAS